MTRQSDVFAARAAADEWAAARGLPPSGGYSGKWYINGYLGGWWPDGWPQWLADYSAPAGSILSDQVVGHQYGSLPIDMDVLADSELIADPPAPAVDCQRYKDALERVVNRIQIELGRTTTAGRPAPLRREIVSEIASEAFAALQ